MTTWNDIPKPTTGTTVVQTTLQGSPIGLLLALTYATTSSILVGGTIWTDIPKAD